MQGLFGTTGSVAARYDYSPFGEAYTSTGAVTNPLRFASRELDSSTGLYYVRARWYDPYLGRFISEDPIGLAGGINNYAYALNDPVNIRDPTGLEPCLQPDHFRCGETILLPPVTTCWVFSPCWFATQAAAELPPAVMNRDHCMRLDGICVTYIPIRRWSDIGAVIAGIPDDPEYCAGAKAVLLELWGHGPFGGRIRFWNGMDTIGWNGGQRLGQHLTDRYGSFVEYDSKFFFEDRTVAAHEGLHAYYYRTPHPTLDGDALHRLIHRQDDTCASR